MTIHLVTFSDESMSRAARLCIESAKRHGVIGKDAALIYPQTSLWKTDFYRANKELLDKPRGCGYFAWKPFIISEEMRGLNDGRFLIYSDAGVEFIDNVSHIIDRMGHDKPQDDIWLFGNNWEHAHWCKRDVIDAVWPDRLELPITDIARTDAEMDDYNLRSPWFNFGKQVQASVIFFRVSDYSRAFVAEWLKWCLHRERVSTICTDEWRYLIDDSPSILPNHPEFQEHRHDQAILTTLAYREGLRLHYWPAVYNKGGSPEFVYEKLPEYAGDDYPVLFSHHRRRDHEWPVGARWIGMTENGGEIRTMSGAEECVQVEHSDSERLSWLEDHLDRLDTIRAGVDAGMSIRTAIDLLIEGTNY